MNNLLNQSTIIFEQPVDDTTRISLKFERLYALANHYLPCQDEFAGQVCLQAILELLSLLDRPELRSKYYQEVSRIISILDRLKQRAEINPEKLTSTLEDLSRIQSILHHWNGKFAQKLHQDSFIKSLSQQQHTPGGLCTVTLPGFYHWTQQTLTQQRHDLENWLQEFSSFNTIASTLMRVYRQSAQLQSVDAIQGFYQATLDPTMPCHLIRVFVDRDHNVYPRISTGRHGVSIRFTCADEHAPIEKNHRDIDFQLASCSI